MSVGSLDKGTAERCKHLDTHQGCEIYSERPEECKTFRCGYLSGFLSQMLPHTPLIRLRPDRCGLLVTLRDHDIFGEHVSIMPIRENAEGTRLGKEIVAAIASRAMVCITSRYPKVTNKHEVLPRVFLGPPSLITPILERIKELGLSGSVHARRFDLGDDSKEKGEGHAF